MAYTVLTKYPIAHDTVDHQHPRGTKNDNSTNEAFTRKLLEVRPLATVLDLGCSGGGFVKSVLAHGGEAVGIEGSDYSQRNERAEWATIPDRLFTADITKPFAVVDMGYTTEPVKPKRFDVVTMWEVLEHIAKDDLPQLFQNVRRHLKDHGLLIASVTTVSDLHDGHEYHATVRPMPWWLEVIEGFGFALTPHLIDYFRNDWVRSGPDTWDAVFVKRG